VQVSTLFFKDFHFSFRNRNPLFIKIQEQVKPFPNIAISGSLSGIKIPEKYERYFNGMDGSYYRRIFLKFKSICVFLINMKN